MADFGREVTRCVETFQRRIDEAPKAIMRDITGRIINRTPIDFEMKDPGTVGRARANWIAKEGRSGNDTIEEINDAADGRAPVLFARGRTVRNAEEIINGLTIADNPTLTLTNNVPYIRVLEYVSYSRQAPAGMRRITLDEFDMIVDQQIRNTITRFQ